MIYSMTGYAVGSREVESGLLNVELRSVNHRYLDATIDCTPIQRCGSVQVMTHPEAVTFLGILLLVAVAVSLVWFRRRDI